MNVDLVLGDVTCIPRRVEDPAVSIFKAKSDATKSYGTSFALVNSFG
jgi:hypothetical protein